MRVFSSAGDCGDVIYSLPAIQALGGGALWLVPAPYTTNRMTPPLAESLATLVRCQPYIADCRFAEQPEGVNLDTWRQTYRSDLNVADLVCAALRLPPQPSSGRLADRPFSAESRPRPVSPQYALSPNVFLGIF